MEAKGRTRGVDRVSEGHRFSGVVTAIVLIAAFVAAGLVWATAAPSGAVDAQAPVLSIRMQIPDPAAPGGRSDWIELQSFQWEIARPITESLPSGDLASTEFTIVKTVDKASPKLYEACTKGTHLDEVKIELLRGAGDAHKYMEYTLTNALIVGYSSSGSSQGSGPIESIAFTFEKISVTYAGSDTITHECDHWMGMLHGYEATCKAVP